MAGDQARPERNGPGPGRHRPQRRYPEDVATAERQPKLLQWAIPALTGAVLVVSARLGEQQRPAQLAGGLLGHLPTGTSRA